MYTQLPDEVYRLVSLLLDGFAAVLFSVILLTMHQIPVQSGKLKSSFVHSVAVGFATALADMGATFCWNKIPLSAPYRLFGMSDCFLLVLFTAFTARFILMYLDDGRRISLILKYAASILYDVIFVMFVIPPIFNSIFLFPEGQAELVAGPAFISFFAVYSLVTLLPLVALMLTRKKLGTKQTLLLFVLQSGVAVSYGVFWQEVPPTLCLMALFMMVVYILIYQGKVLEAAVQEKELSEKKAELSEMRTRLMLSQIQPHFVYNTLTTIAYLCRKDPENAEKLTNRFSEYLRTNINFLSGRGKVSFEEELQNVQNYLAIEKYRFKDRLQLHYDIQVRNFALPLLTVQPMAENAVKHGITKKEDGGNLWLTTRLQQDTVCIEIRDDGVGFDVDVVRDDDRLHVGLTNVEKRVRDAGGTLTIQSTPTVGTTVTIMLPKGI